MASHASASNSTWHTCHLGGHPSKYYPSPQHCLTSVIKWLVCPTGHVAIPRFLHLTLNLFSNTHKIIPENRTEIQLSEDSLDSQALAKTLSVGRPKYLSLLLS
jgi:hypothetical protein